jgi:hypothetical protein
MRVLADENACIDTDSYFWNSNHEGVIGKPIALHRDGRDGLVQETRRETVNECNQDKGRADQESFRALHRFHIALLVRLKAVSSVIFSW